MEPNNVTALLGSHAAFEILGLLYNRQIQPQEAVKRLQALAGGQTA